MAIKILEQIEPGSPTGKVTDAEVVKFTPEDNSFYKDTSDVEKALNTIADKVQTIDETINAKPLFAIVTNGSTVSYDEVDGMYRVSAQKNGDTSIQIINTSKIGVDCTISVLNTVTNAQYRYKVPKGGQSSISLGNLTVSGTYSFTITGTDSFGTSMRAGIYDGNGVNEIPNAPIEIKVSVISGDLSFSNPTLKYSSKCSNQLIFESDRLYVSDSQYTFTNNISLDGTINYPDTSSKIYQSVGYSIKTQNVYRYNKTKSKYVSIYNDDVSTPGDVFDENTFLRYINKNNQNDYKYIPINTYLLNDGEGSVSGKDYYLDVDEVVIKSKDDVLSNPSDQKHDRRDDNISNIALTSDDDRLEFKTQLAHTILLNVSILNKESDGRTSIIANIEYPLTIYPMHISNITNNRCEGLSYILKSSNPSNLMSIYDNDYVQLDFALLAPTSTTNPYEISYELSKHTINGEDVISKTGAFNNKYHGDSLIIKLGTLAYAEYTLTLYDTITGSNDKRATKFKLFVNQSSSKTDYVRDKDDKNRLIFCFDAAKNTSSNKWFPYNKDKDELIEDSYYIDLYGLDYSADSINGWKTESYTSKDDGLTGVRSFVRFTGESYGKGQVQSGDNINELLLSDILNSNSKNAMTFEIVYRTQCVGEMAACVVSTRLEESNNDKNFTFADTDKYSPNPGITVSHNQAIFCTSSNVLRTPIKDNEWKHVTFVFKQIYTNPEDSSLVEKVSGSENVNSAEYNPISTLRIYVNGILTAVENISDQHLENTGTGIGTVNSLFKRCESFILNAHHNSATDTITGFGNCDISVIRAYNYALSNDEVYTNYISTLPVNEQPEIMAKNEDNMPAIYLIKNTKVPDGISNNRKSGTKNTTFSSLSTITEKEDSKVNAVNCSMLYKKDKDDDGTIYNNVDVYLQGTSTLQFPVKNFRLRFYENQYVTNPDNDKEFELDNDGNKILILGGQDKKASKLKVTPKDGWVPDYIYTLKADYMESAHLNNTPTAKFYDKVVDLVSQTSTSSTKIKTGNKTYRYQLLSQDITKGQYCLDDHTGEFITVNDYETTYLNKGEKYTGNRYQRIEMSDMPVNSPGRSYFEYITNKDVNAELENPKSIYLTNPDADKLNEPLLTNYNLYIRKWNTDKFEWIKYNPGSYNDDNKASYTGYILYNLRQDYRDAIDGFACRVYTLDCPTDIDETAFNSYYTFDNGTFSQYNLVGTMMFNYDKTANALGFVNKPVFEDEYTQYVESVLSRIPNIKSTYINTAKAAICKNMLSGEYTDHSRDDITIKITSTETNDNAYCAIDCNTYYNLVISDSGIEVINCTIGLLSFNDFIGDINSPTIPVYHYTEIYTEDPKGRYIYKNDNFVYGEDTTKYTQSIRSYRDYDYVYTVSPDGEYIKKDDKRFVNTNNYWYIGDGYAKNTKSVSDVEKYSRSVLRTSVQCMLSCEGATNVNYAAGTFYDMSDSYTMTYDSDYLDSYYNTFTETNGTTPRQVQIYDPTVSGNYRVISPDNFNKPISETEFSTVLKNIPIDSSNTVSMYDTYEDISNLEKIIKVYNIKSCYESSIGGPCVFKKDEDGSYVDMIYAFDTMGNLNTGYSIVLYDRESSNGTGIEQLKVPRYAFIMPIVSDSYEYIKISDTSNLDKCYEKYGTVYKYSDEYDDYIVIERDQAKEGDTLYYRNIYSNEKENVHINQSMSYIKDKKSFIGDGLTGSFDAFNKYITESFEHRYVYTDEEDEVKDAIDSGSVNFNVNSWNPVKRIVQTISKIYEEYSIIEEEYANKEKESDKLMISADSRVLEFKNQISELFDINYVMVYYMQMIMLAQADNAGKNSMWDSWDGKKFYVRPYDMDTQCGLNNRGQYVNPPSAEVNTEQSPRYISKGSTSNYDEDWKTDSTHKRFKTFTTSSSRFWNLFYKLYKTEIESTYANLRRGGVYSYDYIINFFMNQTSRVIGEKFYNIDMNKKYLSRADSDIYLGSATTDYIKLIMGNRIDQFSDWLSKRIIFCDTYFNYFEINSDNRQISLRSTNSTNTPLGISVYSPQYVRITVGSDTNKLITYVDTESSYEYGNVKYNGILFDLPITGDDKEISIYGAANIRLFNHLSALSPSTLQISNARKLCELDIDGCTNLTVLNMANIEYIRTLNINGCTGLTSSIDLSGAKNLSSLVISNSKVPSVTLCKGSPLSRFIAEKTTITSMTFSGLKNLKEISITNDTGVKNDITSLTIENCDNIRTLDLRNYEKLTTLKILDCKNLTMLDISGLSNLKELVLSNCPKLHVLNCYNTTAPYLANLNLSALGNNENPSQLHTLDLRSSTSSNGINIIFHENGTDLWYLNAQGSGIRNIVYGVNNLNVKDSCLDFRGFNKLRGLSINNCKNFTIVKNLTANVSASGLFSGCNALKNVINSTINSNSMSSLFRECNNLRDISTFRVIPDNGTSNISLIYVLMGASVDNNIIKTVMNYSRVPKIEKCSGMPNPEGYDKNKYLIKTKLKNITFSSNDDNGKSIIGTMKQSMVKTEESIENGVYINDYILHDEKDGPKRYLKVEHIEFIDVNNINNVTDSYYRINGTMIAINGSNNGLIYYYYYNGWTNIKNFYRQIISEYDNLYSIYDKDNYDQKVDGDVYKISGYGQNRCTTLQEAFRGANPINSNSKQMIDDDTFDGMTKVKNMSLAFFNSSILDQRVISGIQNKLNKVSYKAFNKIGSEVSEITYYRTFEFCPLQYLDYRIFVNDVDDSSKKVKIPIKSMNNAFVGTGFYGFVDGASNTIKYKYYTGNPAQGIKSVLPDTVTDMTRAFRGTNINMSGYDVNGLLSSLVNVEKMSYTFTGCRNIKHICPKVFAKLGKCIDFSATFAGCSNLNVVNFYGNSIDIDSSDDGVDNNRISYGMQFPEYDDEGNLISSVFTLYDYSIDETDMPAWNNSICMDALFSGCVNLTGHIYENIFASDDKGAINLTSIGQSKNKVKGIEGGTETYLGGAFANTSISSYDIGFIRKLPNLTDVSGLFAKFDNDRINNKDSDSKKYYSLNGYYTTTEPKKTREYHPGIPADLFALYSDGELINRNITNTSYMFAGNKLLYLSEHDNNIISNLDNFKYEITISQDSDSSESKKYVAFDYTKRAEWINRNDSEQVYTGNGYELEYSINDDNIKRVSIFYNLPNLSDCRAMFANTSIYNFSADDLKNANNAGLISLPGNSGMVPIWSEEDCSDSSTTRIVMTNKSKKSSFEIPNGLGFNEDILFENNSNLVTVASLFEGSIFRTKETENDMYISDNLFKNCTKLQNTARMFASNINQKAVPSNTLFDSCRSTITSVQSMFDGAFNMCGELPVGNATPLNAYRNFMNLIRIDDGFNYSKYDTHNLIDVISTNTSNTGKYVTSFNNYINNFDMDTPSNGSYRMIRPASSITNKDKIYKINSNIFSPAIMTYCENVSERNMTNVMNTYTINDTILTNNLAGIEKMEYKYFESPTGDYYKYIGESKYESVSNVNSGAVSSDKLEKDENGQLIRYGRTLIFHTTAITNNIFELLSTTKVYRPIVIYRSYIDDDGNNILEPVSDKIYNIKDITATTTESGTKYSIELVNRYSIGSFGFIDNDYTQDVDEDGNTTYMYSATNLFALPVIVVDTSVESTVRSDLYQYSNGLLGSMNKLETVKNMFRNCRHLYGAIPEDIFASRSKSNNLTKLTSIEALFDGCYNLGLRNGTNDNEDKMITSNGIVLGCAVASNNRYMYNYNPEYYYIDGANKYIFNARRASNTQLINEDGIRYIVPNDWLKYAPSITTASRVFRGVLNGTIDRDYNITSVSPTGNTDNDKTIDSLLKDDRKLYIPNGLFSDLTSISDISYVFANCHILTGNLSRSFIAKSVSTLNYITCAFAYTDLRTIGSVNDSLFMFEASERNSALMDAKQVFAYTSNIKNFADTFPRFANKNKFSNGLGVGTTPSESSAYAAFANTKISGSSYTCAIDDKNNKHDPGSDYTNLNKFETGNGYYNNSLVQNISWLFLTDVLTIS